MKGLFFNSINGDRRYKAEDFASYFNELLTTGVFPNPSNNLQVLKNDGMKITVKSGGCNINGYLGIQEIDEVLVVNVANPTTNRTDIVVARWSLTDRNITLAIKENTTDIVRTADTYELCLAEITVRRGASSIEQADIRDTRQDANKCGLVNSLIKADTTDLFLQFEDGFNKWFEDLKNKFGDDAVAKLQAQIQTWLDFKDNGGEIKGVINAPGLQVDGKDVYHPGNKPTPGDIGALPSDGVAKSSEKLQTPRKINGTNFDGTSDITTANWGTTRNIAISDSDGTNTGTLVPVNGSANATLKLPSTIKAGLTGNATTATILQTARTINGTNFNGSANITTATWGAARNITIGGVTRSVNGSANVSWSLTDIGAAAANHTHSYLPLSGGTLTGPLRGTNCGMSRFMSAAADNGSFGIGSSSTCRMEPNGNSLRLFTTIAGTSDSGIRISSDGTTAILASGVIRHSFGSSGAKTGGSMEIEGTVYGMSPTDSPQTLIEYIVPDVVVDGELKLDLDPIYIKMISYYVAFLSNKNIEIKEKGKDYIILVGNGITDILIKGQREGADEYFRIMGGFEHGVTEEQTI